MPHTTTQNTPTSAVAVITSRRWAKIKASKDSNSHGSTPPRLKATLAIKAGTRSDITFLEAGQIKMGVIGRVSAAFYTSGRNKPRAKKTGVTFAARVKISGQ